MNVCITGSGGFVGTHIAEALVRRGDTVIGVDDMSGGDYANHDRVDAISRVNTDAGLFMGFVQNCLSQAFMDDIIGHHEIDTLIHCAANAREGASQFQPVSVTRRNLMAYMTTLTSAIKAGVKNVVLFSSMACYGEGSQPPPFDEDQPLAPEDVYAVNKVAMESITKILSDVHGFKYVIIRPHNVAGEHQCLRDKFRNVVGIFMNCIMRDEPIWIFGDGEQRRAFSYIGDSLPAFIRAVDSVEALHGQAINVGGMEAITVNTLADVVCEVMGATGHPREYQPTRPKEVKYAYSSYEKSQRLLGYAEEYGWRNGVCRMAEWAKAQGPQDWHTTDELELVSGNLPEVWMR